MRGAIARRPTHASFDSRRVAIRRHAALPCQVVREHDFRLVAETTLDVSTFGMLVPAKREVEIGEALIVSFPIPGMWIDTDAVVARVLRGRRPDDEGPAVGIVFEGLGVTARAALAAYLHGRPAPLPRRRPLAYVRRGSPEPAAAESSTRLRASLEDADESVDGASLCAMEAVDRIDGLDVLRGMAEAWRRLAAG